MSNETTNWEALLEAEGLGDIENTITHSKETHTGVGRAAMTAAGELQDQIDFDEDNEDAAMHIDHFLDGDV